MDLRVFELGHSLRWRQERRLLVHVERVIPNVDAVALLSIVQRVSVSVALEILLAVDLESVRCRHIDGSNGVGLPAFCLKERVVVVLGVGGLVLGVDPHEDL